MTNQILTHELLNAKVSYCKDNGKFYWVTSSARNKVGDEASCLTRDGYIAIRLYGKTYQAHRLAWFIEYGEFPKEKIDHINRNRADNRIANLRIATDYENAINRCVLSNNQTGIKGVTFKQRDNRYIARITVNKQRIHLGSYLDIESARSAYIHASLTLHKDYSIYS